MVEPAKPVGRGGQPYFSPNSTKSENRVGFDPRSKVFIQPKKTDPKKLEQLNRSEEKLAKSVKVPEGSQEGRPSKKPKGTKVETPSKGIDFIVGNTGSSNAFFQSIKNADRSL